MNTDTEIAYAAGVVDGEGCILIPKIENRHSIRLVVFNTDSDLLRWLKGRFGGRISCIRRNGRRPGAEWSLTTRAAINFLTMALPYLVVKKSQALTALELYKNILPGKNARVSEEERERRESLRLLIKSQKKPRWSTRGFDPPGRIGRGRKIDLRAEFGRK